MDARVLTAGPDDAREAVVFLHGNPGSADDWTDLATATGKLARSIALDLPGFGETPAPNGFEQSLESHSAHLAAALAALGIERVHLVVHDFGGPVGLSWAASAPERLASVTLIDSGLLPGYRWHWMARLWRTPVLGELLMAATTRGAFRRSFRRTEPMGLPRDVVDRMYDQYDRPTRRAALALYRSLDDPGQRPAELVEAIRERNVPALVVWGEHDSFIPSAYAARQRELFPSADVHVLRASGHWPFIDDAATVERLLTSFLASLGPMRKRVAGEARP